MKNDIIEELDENMADASENALESIIRKEEYLALYHAISLLNSSYKEVITLFYFEDLSVKDIATVINKSEASTRSSFLTEKAAKSKLRSTANPERS